MSKINVSPMYDLDRSCKNKQEEIPETGISKFAKQLQPFEVKNTHMSISKKIADTSKYYQTVFGSDSRINKEVIEFLSTMQIALYVLDLIYQKQTKSADTGDLGTLREEMIVRGRKITVGNIEVTMTPIHYESYLQIYKTPKAAVKSYHRFLELKKERVEAGVSSDENPKKWNDKKSSEWEKLERNEELAIAFSKSRRQMLNLDSFSQADIDYAFRLRTKEMRGRDEDEAKGEMYTSSASASITYMSLFFNKIFGGIQDEVRKEAGKGGLPEEGLDRQAKWLNKYLFLKTNAKERGMKMILRGMVRSLNDPSADTIKKAFHHFLMNGYLRRAFPQNNSRGEKLEMFAVDLAIAYEEIKQYKGGFSAYMDELIKAVLREEKQANNWMIVS